MFYSLCNTFLIHVNIILLIFLPKLRIQKTEMCASTPLDPQQSLSIQDSQKDWTKTPKEFFSNAFSLFLSPFTIHSLFSPWIPQPLFSSLFHLHLFPRRYQSAELAFCWYFLCFNLLRCGENLWINITHIYKRNNKNYRLYFLSFIW